MSKRHGTGDMILPALISASLVVGGVMTFLFNMWWHWPYILAAIAISLGAAKAVNADTNQKGKK